MYRDTSREDEEREPRGDVLLRIDASGRAGARGRDGLRGADGGGAGADGAPGSHAGAAEAGAGAGRVEVVLRDDGVGRVEIVGRRVAYDGREERVEVLREIGDQGSVDLVARGGQGGAGGRGGDGGAGARGRAGADATRYSSGGNGGPGGDGGAGGRGTSGAAGGRGGVVNVRVRDEDTHLLLLVRHGVDGGPGGAAGLHGYGGSAGAGGPGGTGHSWTTTETYRDSQGHTQTRTHHHHNPGGSSGASGRSGMPGSGPLRDGAPGATGTFTIEVEGARGGVELHEARYHLALAGLEIHTDDADGITEPGERVELRRVRVTNVGGMPTPRHHDTRLSVLLSNWASPIEGASLLVPRGLAAGQTVELEGTLPFLLRDHVSVAESDPLAEAEPVEIDAHVPDVRRSFEGFLVPELDGARTLLVRFPVALSVLEGLASLAADEMTRVRFAVRNQSRRALGLRSESRRRVCVTLRLFESELDDRHVVLFDEAGLPCLLGGEGLVREIERLEPGQDAIFELALGIRRDAPSYRALRVRLTLEIGRLEEPEVLRVVQHRALEVRVAERVGRERFDWLLVTHHRTTREEVDAWRALAARQGAALALYDLSLHGDLRLDQPFEAGPSLVSRADGGLVIVLGYPLETPTGPRAPASFLTEELLREMGRARADLLVLGGPGTLRDWARGGRPELAPDATPLEGADALLTLLAQARRDTEEAERGAARAHRVAVYEVVWGFETPSEETLQRRARDLAERLSRLHPEREHEVIFELDPDATPSWAPIRKRRLGWLRVLSRAAGRSGMAHLAIEDDALHEPATIASESIAEATLLARGVDDRLRALEDALERGDATLSRALADAILVTIASEQLSVLRRTRARAGLDREGLVRALVALERVSRARLLPTSRGGGRPLDVEGVAATIVVHLAARARFFARAQASLWERIPGVAWLRRAGSLVSVTDEATARFFTSQSEDDDVARTLEDRCRVELEVLEASWRAAREAGQRDKAAFARVLLLTPVWSSRFTVDEELVVAHEPVAIAASEWAAARAEGVDRAHASSSTEAALDALRARLALTDRTEERLAAVLEAEETGARAGARGRA